MPPQVMSPAVKARREKELMEASLNRLVQRVDQTIEQCRRFEEIANELSGWASYWPTEALQCWLERTDSDVTLCETALVALALRGTHRAGVAIDGHDPSSFDADHQLFYEVVRIEWEQRAPDEKHRWHAA